MFNYTYLWCVWLCKHFRLLCNSSQFTAVDQYRSTSQAGRLWDNSVAQISCNLFQITVEYQHWRDKLGRIALYVMGRNIKRFHICLLVCAVCIYEHAMKQMEREATSPVWYLLPVDAVSLIPQMWLQAWHAWLSRWRLTWRQRAWPVLAHSVTSTVPT